MPVKEGPNILISGTPGVGKTTLAQLICFASISYFAGTPGVGKTTLAQLIAERTNMEAISVGDLAKANNFFCGFDEELQCPILDEDKVLDELEDMIAEGGKIVDYHGSEFFPERFFDIVFVLRTDNTLLYDRLASRGYAGKKLEDNVECEIMNVLRDEALDNYAAEIVHELPSNTPDDMENNLQRILAWIESWMRDNNIVTS